MRSLLVLVIVALVCAQTRIKVRPVNANGIDYINMANPALSYIANLVYDPQSNNSNSPAIYFTADKSNPNVWLTRVDSNQKPPNDWWFEQGQIFQTGNLPPFLGFDVVSDYIYGISLPSAVNNAQAYDTAFQFVYNNGNLNQPGSEPRNYPGYSFYSVIMDRNQNLGKHYYGYATGWADDTVNNITGFFVARFQSTRGPGNPAVIFNPITDVITGLSDYSCYDIWTTVKKPYMWLDKGFLYVAVTGRCAYIIRVALPPDSLSPPPFVNSSTACKPSSIP